MAAFRLENVARVCKTLPDVSRTCTVNVSKAVVVLVSAVSICSQKVNVAVVAVEGTATVCVRVSVVVLPHPSSQASNFPECGGSSDELLMTSTGE